MKKIVLKVSGSDLDDVLTLTRLVADIGKTLKLPVNLVVVHGASHQLEMQFKAKGIALPTERGKRLITDARTMQAVEAVATELNKKFCTKLSDALIPAVPLLGKSLGLFNVEQPEATLLLGDVARVRRRLLEKWLFKQIVPVISPVSTDASGKLLDVNADEAAGKIASEIKADVLIFLINTRGIIISDAGEKKVIKSISLADVEDDIEKKIIPEGLIWKVRSAAVSVACGTRQAFITDIGGAEKIIFNSESVATEITM
jgi:acetylglutamate kinase